MTPSVCILQIIYLIYIYIYTNMNIITIITKHSLLYTMCNVIIINVLWQRAILYLPLRCFFVALLITGNIYINYVTVYVSCFL